MQKFSIRDWASVITIALIVAALASWHYYEESKYEDRSSIPEYWRGVWKSNDRWDYHANHETIIIEGDLLLWVPPEGDTEYIELAKIQASSDFPDLRLRLSFADMPQHFTDSNGWSVYFNLKDLQMFETYCPFCNDTHTFSLVGKQP